MQQLLKLLSNDSALSISTIKALGPYTETRPLNLLPDSDLIRHDKHVDKEYLVEDDLDLHDDYPFILKARLEDYGYPDGKSLRRDFNDCRGVRYEFKSLNQRRSKIHLRGVLTGSYAEMDIEAKCRLKIHAIEKDDYDNLVLHESLAIEGYLLQQETNYKLAFFMYFSAAESIVRAIIEKIKEGAKKETAKKLEHAALNEKVKIAGKHAFNVDDLKLLPIWGVLMGLLKDCTALRNKIAHAQKMRSFSVEDANLAAALYIVIKHTLLRKRSSMKDIVDACKTKKKTI